MQAAERHIIIDKGVDFTIKLKVTEGIGSPKNLSGYIPKMRLMKTTEDENIAYASQTGGSIIFGTSPAYIVEGKVTDAINGEFEVIIDSSATSNIDTNLPKFVDDQGNSQPNKNPFATEYTYFYSIDLLQGGSTPTIDKEELRILRGKCAVRA